MNKQESDILNTLFIEPFINQRILSETSGHSLGVVNKSIKTLINTQINVFSNTSMNKHINTSINKRTKTHKY